MKIAWSKVAEHFYAVIGVDRAGLENRFPQKQKPPSRETADRVMDQD
jgi:hypothetical protein